MRLLIINPLGVDFYNSMTEEIGRRAAAPGTEVTARSLAGTGVPPTSFLPAASLFMNQLLVAVEQGEKDGFDAVVIACCSDPGLEDAKDLVSIPVTAPMEAAVATGRGLGRLAVIAPRIESGRGENLPQNANWVRRLIHRYGGGSAFAGVLSAPTGHPSEDEVARLLDDDDIAGLRDAVRREMSASIAGPAGAAAESAWRDLDATVLFFACTFWSDLLGPIRERLPIPVLDPLVTPVRYSELLASAGSKV
jgi:Asp/Glu/hydantoin racemase